MAQDSDRIDEIRDAVWLLVKLLARDGHDPDDVVLVFRAMADTIEEPKSPQTQNKEPNRGG